MRLYNIFAYILIPILLFNCAMDNISKPSSLLFYISLLELALIFALILKYLKDNDTEQTYNN